MSASRSVPERLEPFLIVGMVLGIVLIAQRYSIDVYRWGLGLLVISTILEIAVGNLPTGSGWRHSVLMIAVILCVFVGVFVLGIWLVPLLSRLAQ